MSHGSEMGVVSAFRVFGMPDPENPDASTIVSRAAEILTRELRRLSGVIVSHDHCDLRDDVVQITLFKLYTGNRTRELDTVAQVLAYLRVAVRNNFLSELEQRGLSSLDEHMGWEPVPVQPRQREALFQQSAWQLLFDLTEKLCSQSRKDLAANLRLCLSEWARVLEGDATLEEIAEQMVSTDLAKPDERRARNQFEQRHCRARRRIAEFIDHKVTTGDLHPDDAEALRACLDATNRRQVTKPN